MNWQDCAALVERGDPDRFASAMTAPVAARARLFPIYAFNLEIARAPWVVSEPPLAEIRLQWWRDAIAEIYEGAAPRRHEVVTPLAEVIAETGLPRGLFDAAIDARRFDIYSDPHPSRAALDAWLSATGGSLAKLAARALGHEGDALRAAGLMGRAGATGALIAALPVLYAQGRDPVPHATPLDRAEVMEGRVPEALGVAIADLARAALDQMGEARALRGSTPRTLVPVLLHLHRVEPLLEAAVAAPRTVLTEARLPSEFTRRAAFALRAATGRW